MTSNEKALKLVQECLDDWPYAATRVVDIMTRLEKVKELLKEHETKWINVNEKLPDEDGRYLLNYVAFNFQSMKVMRFAKDLHSVDDYKFRNEHRPGWYECDDEVGYFENTGVTHWMPLPNAPQDALNIV